MSLLLDLSGKTSLVTGAGSGFGRIFCEALAENGSSVICVDIDLDSARHTALTIARNGVRTLAVRGDVTNQDEVRAVFKLVDENFGSLDVLFNNAGITSPSFKLHEMPLGDWNKVINVDLTGVFLCMQEGIRLMLRQHKGSIVNVASIFGLTGWPSKSNYCAAKAGVIALTKSAAVDYGSDGIRINAIAPGFFGGTKLGEGAGLSREALHDFRADISSVTPLQRIGEPDELQGLAVYLASDASSFVTGATFTVDGGFMSRR